MNSINQEKNYQIYIEFDFIANEKLLHFIYSPILGHETISLYKYLLSLHAFQATMGNIIKIDIDSLLINLKIEYNQYQIYIKSLEAMNLIQTFIDSNKQDLIIYKINEPLKWVSFSKNPNYMSLLKSKLGELEFEKRKFLFDQNNPLTGLINVSTTFENEFDYKKQLTINFDIIYDHLYKTSNKIINIDENIKVILDNAFQKYHFSYDELCQLINQSVFKGDNELIISAELLIMNIKKAIDVKDVRNFNHQLKVNRNNQIFLSGNSVENFKYVINDYHTLNSEQYLSSIQKHALCDIELNLIKTLRKQYQLPDFIINILIDFCIFKNNGRIEPLYINKIASTINRLNLDNVNKVINHLQSANEKVRAKSRIEW
ncbi:MAG: DnaD domain protein [Mycoplasma sp.]